MGNVSMKDHSRRERREGGFTYVSVRSVAHLLEQHGLADQSFEIPAPAGS